MRDAYKSAPCFQIQGGIKIRIGLEATRKTEELGLAFTIGFIAVTARRTSSGTVSRVYKDHGNARLICLVNDKPLQFVKSPIAHLPTHFPRKSRGSFPNPLEVFQSECLTGRKCRSHKLLTDSVVQPAGVTPRLAAHLFERTLRPFRPCFLQVRTMGANTATGRLNAFARIGTACAIGGNFNDAKVNPQNALRLNQRRVGKAHRRQQIEVAIDKGEVTFPLLKSQKAALILTAHERQFQPAVNRPDGNLSSVCVPAQDTVIVGNRACRLKRAPGALVQLVGVGHFTDTPNDDLSGKTRSNALDSVLPFVKRVLAEGLVLPSPRADTVTNGIGGLHGALQGVRLFGCNEQFDLCSKFQSIDIIPAFTQGCQCRPNLIGQFLHVPKGPGLLAR